MHASAVARPRSICINTDDASSSRRKTKECTRVSRYASAHAQMMHAAAIASTDECRHLGSATFDLAFSTALAATVATTSPCAPPTACWARPPPGSQNQGSTRHRPAELRGVVDSRKRYRAALHGPSLGSKARPAPPPAARPAPAPTRYLTLRSSSCANCSCWFTSATKWKKLSSGGGWGGQGRAGQCMHASTAACRRQRQRQQCNTVQARQRSSVLCAAVRRPRHPPLVAPVILQYRSLASLSFRYCCAIMACRKQWR